MNPADPIGPELLTQIEAYYDGELPEAAAATLRERLRDDPQLAAVVAEWEAVYRHGLRPSKQDLRERAQLRATFNAIGAEQPPAGASVRILPAAVWWAAAAGAMILLAAGWWVFARPADPATRLADEYFAWLPRQELVLGMTESSNKTGLVAYDRKEYAEAYPLIVAGIATGQLDSVNLLYAGVAALGADRPNEARSALKDLLATQRYPLEEGELRYYLALAELSDGDLTAATRWLAEEQNPTERNRELLIKIQNSQ